MPKAKDLVNNYAKHNHLGRVFVDSQVQGSHTKVNITVMERGKGWNDFTESYKGKTVKTKEGQAWFRGENYQHGFKDVVHINTLTKID